jgi:hypothetical protein
MQWVSEREADQADSDQSSETYRDPSEPALLDARRNERRVSDSQSMQMPNWVSAVPSELFERLRAQSAAGAEPAASTLISQPANEPMQIAAAEAALAPLPEAYRGPFLPESIDFHPEPPTTITLPPAFQGLDWSFDDGSSRMLVSVRPVLDIALAERVAELLERAPGMSAVRSLGSTEDIAAFEAEYDGPVSAMEAVAQALRGIGASLVSTGDREFYLAIQGQLV